MSVSFRVCKYILTSCSEVEALKDHILQSELSHKKCEDYLLTQIQGLQQKLGITKPVEAPDHALFESPAESQSGNDSVIQYAKKESTSSLEKSSAAAHRKSSAEDSATLHMSPKARARVISTIPALEIIPSVESATPPAASSTTVTRTLMPSERQFHAPAAHTHSYDLAHHRSSVVRVIDGADGRSTAL